MYNKYPRRKQTRKRSIWYNRRKLKEEGQEEEEKEAEEGEWEGGGNSNSKNLQLKSTYCFPGKTNME